MSYNGYRNWTQWNVSLWINNDEALYRVAKMLVRIHGKQRAAERLLQDLNDNGIHETPDGAKYSVTAIRAALVGI